MKQKKASLNPKDNSNILGHLFFCWVNSLIRIGSKRKVTQDDLFELSEEDRAENLAQEFEQVWEDEILRAQVGRREPNLWRAMAKFFTCKEYSLVIFWRSWETISTYSKPVLLWCFLKLLIQRKNNDHSPYLLGSATAAISAAIFIQAFSRTHNNIVSKTMGMRLTVAVTSLIHKKLLTSSRYNLSKETPGQVFNLVSNDMQRLREIVKNVQYSLAFIIVGPITFALLCTLVQWQAISGAFFIIICGFIQVLISKGYAYYRTLQASATDQRLAVVNEVIKGIRAVKMHAWEWSYLEIIRACRRKEAKLAQTKTTFLSVLAFFYSILIVLGIGASVYTLLWTGFHLETVQLFVLMTILHHLGESIMRQIYCTLFTYDGYTAIKRIESFLLSEEIKPLKSTKQKKAIAQKMKKFATVFGKQGNEYSILETDEPEAVDSAAFSTNGQDDPCVKISELNSGWSQEDSTLHNMSLHIKPNTLVMVTGPVGSGKTTLLMTILREIPLLSGEFSVQGKIAYVSQIPWIFTGTVQENILFGMPMDDTRYQRVLDVCDLNPDISSFPKGDLSMIGQRGVMLSGGQRARVALARAVYSNADIMLLDDPLSAVDAKVGEHLLEKCICGELSSKIRILVTHQLQHLHRADRVVVFKDGRVVGQGTYDELAKHDELYHLIVDYRDVTAMKTTTPLSVYTTAKEEMDRERGIDLAEEDEHQDTGSLSWKLYWAYFTAGLPGCLVVLLWIYFFLGSAYPYICFWWLKVLVQMPQQEQRSAFALGVYGGILAGNIIIPFLQVWFVLIVLLRSSVKLYDKMTVAVIKSPVVFFDKNPVGRILNRFSKDIGKMDDVLPITFVFAACSLVPFFVATVFMAIVNYWFLLITIPTLVVFVVICRYYLRPARDLSRLEALLCSPVYDHVSETMEGLEVIHSAHTEDNNLRKLYRLQNSHTKAFQLTLAMGAWIGLYIDLVTAVFITLVVIGSVILHLDPATCGLLFVIGVTLLGLISYGVHTFSEVETLMVSVERVKNYIELPSEPGYDRKHLAPHGWPNKGAISVQGLSLKYLEGGANVLNDINFEVNPRERVGIAGRTGAGKSSLVAALLRMPDPTGRVIVDGIDLGILDIQAVRRSMAVISQNPILFSGSLKHSLDPFSHFNDDQIWTALEVVQMKDRVSRLEGQLEHWIGEGGVGFSAGETQLICLARALLQRCKILVLDEATANVDYKTDQLVQQVIREKFAHCTVLTIAHRLNTIMDYDRVLVLDGGHVVEYDSPAALAAKPDGTFAKLVHSQQSNG